MPFVNLFLLHDFTTEECDAFGDYYGIPNNTQFEAYLCTLRLRLADGTPRPAWQAVVDAAREAGLPSRVALPISRCGAYYRACGRAPLRLENFAMQSLSYQFDVVFPLLGFVVVPWLNRRALAKRLRSNPALGGQQTFSLTDEGITLKTPAAASSVQWSALLRIVETPEYFLFFTLPNLAFFLPRAAVPISEIESVRAFIATHARSPTELTA